MAAKKRKPKRKTKTFRSSARQNPNLPVRLGFLGDRIRELRQDEGLTLEEVASDASLDEKHLQELEAGKGNPTFATILGVAEALDVSLERLFKGI